MTMIEQLEHFQQQDHFSGDDFLYTGVEDKQLRDQLNQYVASTAQNFIQLYKNANTPTPTQLLQTVAQGIQQIDPNDLDTEDREQVATTFEQFLDIIGLESSEDILNTWLYGEEINQPIQNRNS